MMKSITVLELVQLLNDQADIRLVDVREPWEHAAFNIGGQLIPVGNIVQQASQINRQIPVILYCQKGVRSQVAIQRLQQKYPFNNLVNLKGGIEAWIKYFPSEK